MQGHKFTIIEEVYNQSLSKLKIPSLLKHREDLNISQGLNISLNYPQDFTGSSW